MGYKPKPALAPRQKKAVKRMINRAGEPKYAVMSSAFTNSTNGDITNTSKMFQLTQIAQGNTDITRNGDRLKLLSMRFLGVVYTPTVAAQIRIIFFVWKPSGNGPSATSDILLPGPSGGVDVCSLYNHDTRSDYKVLKDIKLVVQPNAVERTRWISFNKRIPVRCQNQQFVGGSSATGTNQVWGLWVSDVASTPPTIAKANVKFAFTDI